MLTLSLINIFTILLVSIEVLANLPKRQLIFKSSLGAYKIMLNCVGRFYFPKFEPNRLDDISIVYMDQGLVGAIQLVQKTVQSLCIFIYSKFKVGPYLHGPITQLEVYISTILFLQIL